MAALITRNAEKGQYVSNFELYLITFEHDFRSHFWECSILFLFWAYLQFRKYGVDLVAKLFEPEILCPKNKLSQNGLFICCWPSELNNYSLDDVTEEIFINLETLVSADIVKQCRICKNFVQPALKIFVSHNFSSIYCFIQFESTV